MSAQHELDARGMICPMPVLRARKMLLSLPPGDDLVVTVTDKNAPADFDLFCKESGHTFVSAIPGQDGSVVITLRVSSAPSPE